MWPDEVIAAHDENHVRNRSTLCGQDLEEKIPIVRLTVCNLVSLMNSTSGTFAARRGPIQCHPKSSNMAAHY